VSTTTQIAVLARAPRTRADQPSSHCSASAGRPGPQQVGRQGAAQLAHHRGRRGALPHDVADDDRDPPAVEDEHVVPVAAGAAARRRGQVARRQVQPLVLGQRRGEQAVLQRVGQVAAGVGQRRPLERQRRLAGERAQVGLLVVVEGAGPGR
jgi:hypothetical protein